MLKHLVVLVRFFCFWLVLALLDRLIFIAFNWSEFSQHSWSENLGPFYQGLRMDASLAAYISVIPLLFYLAKWLFPKLQLNKNLAINYTRFFILFFALTCVVNLNIYNEWGSKINYRALDFVFDAPQEALASSLSSPLLLSFFIMIGFIFFANWLSKQMIDFEIPEHNLPLYLKIPITVLILGVNFLFIRGGWQLTPINQSMSYFSEKPILNYASVNTPWNLLYDISKNLSGQDNPYQYFPLAEAKAISSNSYPETKAQSPEILLTKRPNVVLIILESFTAQVVESLGGEKGVAPEIEKVIKQGVLFENTYASGDRTDKGTIAILSAFPSQAIRSIVNENGKQEKLPALSQIFKENDYSTSFYYGGESEFYGNKAFMLSHGNEVLVDKNDFLNKDMNSKWGAFDGVVYQKQLADFKNTNQPFFSTILTLTNHEPFELPVKGKYPGTELANLFRSTAHYADSSLGAYLRDAAKQTWYKNTLFIIVADHGHRLPSEKYEKYHPMRYRIPLIFFGEVIKPEYRGSRIQKYGGQTDIAQTLFNQMGIDASRFKWSKDLLNPDSRDFAFYDYDNGFGWITPEQSLAFDNVGKQVVYREKNTGVAIESEMLKNGKAYLQTVFQEYLDY